MTPDFLTIDYLEEARSRSTYQFQDKAIFDKYLELLIDQQMQIQQVFKDLLQKRSIDTATGATLDIIGEIVGQPRELISADLFKFFGLIGAVNSDSFGDLFNTSLGGPFYDLGTTQSGNILLDDNTYRLFIKAKIVKNTTSSTPEEFISFVNYLLGTEKTRIIEGQAEYTVLFGRELTSLERVLLTYVSNEQGYPSRLIPKTVGVKVNFGNFIDGNYFGFQGAPNAKGFGDYPYKITSGYGAGYGVYYGLTTGSGLYTLVHDGSFIHNGSRLHNSAPNTDGVPIGGGIFATLF